MQPAAAPAGDVDSDSVDGEDALERWRAANKAALKAQAASEAEAKHATRAAAAHLIWAGAQVQAQGLGARTARAHARATTCARANTRAAGARGPEVRAAHAARKQRAGAARRAGLAKGGWRHEAYALREPI